MARTRLKSRLAAMGIGAGDEVIVPNATFVATASAVLFAGALPVLVDVRADSYCIDPELAEAAITENTKAIIAVHMGGRPADLDQLTAVAQKHGLMLLEDAAHAHGKRMARAQSRHFWRRRHLQLSSEQDDDGRRGRHDHQQR